MSRFFASEWTEEIMLDSYSNLTKARLKAVFSRVKITKGMNFKHFSKSV